MFGLASSKRVKELEREMKELSYKLDSRTPWPKVRGRAIKATGHHSG